MQGRHPCTLCTDGGPPADGASLALHKYTLHRDGVTHSALSQRRFLREALGSAGGASTAWHFTGCHSRGIPTCLLSFYPNPSSARGLTRGGFLACSQVAARRGGRSIMYQDESQYVLLEPGQDETFVTPEELQHKLEQTLGSWDGEWPQDLRKYDSTEEAAAYLMESVCELDLGGSLGAMQWYSVRLE